jgi:phosphoribosylformimino-5-aminoimidazole carboxamide ribotide isomerase
MTLNHVGAQQGVAIELLSLLSQRSQHHHLYAAGGVSNMEDIKLLERLGIHGALIATALHTQQINTAMLEAIGA